jgi:hypothetical protein
MAMGYFQPSNSPGAPPPERAYFVVSVKRLYLGRHDLPETVQKYHQVVAELLASGGQLPVEKEAIRIRAACITSSRISGMGDVVQRVGRGDGAEGLRDTLEQAINTAPGQGPQGRLDLRDRLLDGIEVR